MSELIPPEWKDYLILPDDKLVTKPDDLEHCYGIYSIYGKDRNLIYIGRSVSIQCRLRDHRRRTHFFDDEPTYYSCRQIMDDTLQRHIEVAHIHALTPSENMRYEPGYWSRHKEMVALIKRLWGKE